jgi:hypothetical protein
MSAEGTTTMTATQHRDEDLAPELADLHLVDRPDGPGAAMMISAGIGIFTLGLLTVLSEASTGMNTWLTKWQWGKGVGALAGKTTVASIVYVISLIVLWVIWRAKNVNLKTAFYSGLALGIVGAIATYPTVFKKFAP